VEENAGVSAFDAAWVAKSALGAEAQLARIEQRNKFSVGETIEIMKPDGSNIEVTVEGIYTETGEAVDSAPHPKQLLWVKLSEAPEKYDLLRRSNTAQ